MIQETITKKRDFPGMGPPERRQ